jgi:ribosomal protein S17E
MDDYYDDNQKDRQKQAKSSRDFHQMDDRQHKTKGNKKVKLVHDETGDFHPNDSPHVVQYTTIPALCRDISKTSDDDISDLNEQLNYTVNENESNNMFSVTTAIETPASQVSDTVNLTDLIKPRPELKITPVDQRYTNWVRMQYNCCEAQPVVDHTIHHDLQRTFNYLSSAQLFILVRCFISLPYWICSKNGELHDPAKRFMSNYKITEEHLWYVNTICKQILYRSSNGVLFIKNNKFFARTNSLSSKQQRNTITGYPTLKSDETWEHPWETVVRIVKQKVEYRDNDNDEWQLLDLEKHVEYIGHHPYLECLFKSRKDSEYDRYIGMFIIRLKENVQLRVKYTDTFKDNGDWYSFDDIDNRSALYTMYPFVRYIQKQPRLT